MEFMWESRMKPLKLGTRIGLNAGVFFSHKKIADPT
jgi:hypothetical protein